MSATPSRSNAFAPPPGSTETGIMPDLYRLSVGPLRAAYYQRQFSRFESLGKAVPSWNPAAACFTLAWLAVRKLWRHAALHLGAWVAMGLVWALTLRGHVPLQVEVSACVLGLLLLCVVPGFLANGWYYNQVRTQTLDTLTAANSISQARAKLAERAPTVSRLYAVAGIQAVVGIALAAWLYQPLQHASSQPTAVQPSGPPHLVIPAVSSVQRPPADLPLMEPALPELDALPVATAAPSSLYAAASAPALEATPAAPAPEATAAQPAVIEPQESVPATVAVPTHPAPPPETALASAVSAAAPAVAPAIAPRSAKTALAASATASKTAPASKLKPKTIQPAKTSPAAADAEGRLIPGKYYLHAGVYAQVANVDRAVKQLQSHQLPTVRQTIQSNKGP